MKKVYEFCVHHNLKIDYLVNNAGFGIYGVFEKTSMQLEREMIHLNITSLTELTKYFAVDMKKRGFGLYAINYLKYINYIGKVRILGVQDKFIDQGTRRELLDDCGLTTDNIINTIKNG